MRLHEGSLHSMVSARRKHGEKSASESWLRGAISIAAASNCANRGVPEKGCPPSTIPQEGGFSR